MQSGRRKTENNEILLRVRWEKKNEKKENASGYLLWKKDKNFWISYDGIVTLGIDSSKLDVKVDGENVKIHILELHFNEYPLIK